MDKLEFNKIFFPRNTDDIFKLAIMFSRHGKVSLASQEILFYSNDSMAHAQLAYIEMYNELIDYTCKWLQGLDTLKNENDWMCHRNRLSTRFKLTKRVNLESVEQFFNKNKKVFPEKFIHNTGVLWNNAVYLAEGNKYKNESNDNTWKLWDVLIKYKEERNEEIIGNKALLKEFQKIIKYRKEDEFFDSQRVILTSAILKEIDKIEKDLSIIFFKDELKGELNIISSIINPMRKRLKI
jgi:hypothetical protein